MLHYSAALLILAFRVMTSPKKIAVAGVGLIGKRHAQILSDKAINGELAAVVDPSSVAKAYAKSVNVPYFSSLQALFAQQQPDGIVIATPNQLHVEHGLQCIAHHCPILVEKPVASSSEDASRLVQAAREAGVSVLVGHHRRYNPIIQQAKRVIDTGQIGRVTAINGTCWFSKPEEYFAPEWRRRAGAGPIMINSVHDVDLFRYLCGEIVSVQARSSNVRRGFVVEDTVVALLEFGSGVLGTFTLSDTVASPWSWEITSGENAEFSHSGSSCYLIGGTEGSLSLPDLTIWRHKEGGHWKDPIHSESIEAGSADPLHAQIEHFLSVVEGREQPLVSAEEGLRSLRVVEAIRHSALSGQAVAL